MVGNPDTNDNTFDPDNYEEFYSHHHFQPIGLSEAYRVNEVIPRFSWAFDVIEELSTATKKPLKVLDLGCLDGSFCLSVAKQLGIEVTGVDLTKDGIDIAKERSKGLPAQFYQGSIEAWLKKAAKEGKQFDVITWFEIIEHVEDPVAVQKQIDKVLAPGGTILCSTPAFESPYFGKNDVKNKCHIRLYTTRDEDYEEMTDHQVQSEPQYVRKATSLPNQIGKERIVEMEVINELINVRYK